MIRELQNISANENLCQNGQVHLASAQDGFTPGAETKAS